MGWTRRSYLAALAAATSIGMGGCIDDTMSEDGPTSPAETTRTQTSTRSESATPTSTDERAGTPTGSPTPSPTPTPTRTPPPEETLRARGEPVSVDRTVTDEPGYDDDIEYFPSNETVRMASAWRGNEPIMYDTWPFERWATYEAAEVGLDRAASATENRLGTDDFGHGVGRSPEDVDVDDPVISFHVGTSYDREGNVISTPSVSLSQLADAAPESVDVTLTLKGDTFSRTVPVYVEYSGSVPL